MADTTCFFWIKFFTFWFVVSGLASLLTILFCPTDISISGGCIAINAIISGIICSPILFANQIYHGVINKQHSGKKVKKELDKTWLEQNYETIEQQYMNHYVAIYHKEIIDCDKDINVLRERIKGRQLNPYAVFIEFIGPKE